MRDSHWKLSKKYKNYSQATMRIFLMLGMAFYCLPTLAQISYDTAFVNKYEGKVHQFSSLWASKFTLENSKIQKQAQRTERRILRQLKRKNPEAALTVLKELEEEGQVFANRIKEGKAKPVYIPMADSMHTSVIFLNGLLNKNGFANSDIKLTIPGLTELSAEAGNSNELIRHMEKRFMVLKKHLSRVGRLKDLKAFNKKLYYYKARVQSIHFELKDPGKLVTSTLSRLSEDSRFSRFFDQHSQLTQLFGRRRSDKETQSVSLDGLQQRSEVNKSLAELVGTAKPEAAKVLESKIRSANQSLAGIKNNLLNGLTFKDKDEPYGFRVNNANGKSLADRLTLEVNLQSDRASGILPVTSNLGVSVGYRISDKFIAGVGTAHRMGWGQSIKHIRISHQGWSLRSFVDGNIKGNLWLTVGYELNSGRYLVNVNDTGAIRWTSSGLVGLSRTFSKTQRIRKTVKVSILWDYLKQIRNPRLQTVFFRIGYQL